MIRLLPKWKKIKQVNYKVYRRDFFRAGEITRFPIENRYNLSLNHLDSYSEKTLLGATYPDGILKLLTSFQPYSGFIDLEDDFTQKKGNQFSYTLNSDSQLLNLTNLKQIHKYGFWLEKAIAKSNLIKRKKKHLLETISWFFEDEKDKHDYLQRDLANLHEFYGLKIDEPLFLDLVDDDSLGKEGSKLSKKERKLLTLFEDMPKGRSMVKVNFDEKLVYLDTVWGINLWSVDKKDWHDFKTIRNQFKANNFDIEQFDNITLHHKKYIFSRADKVLNYYSHQRRTVCASLEKLIDVEMIRQH